jgi:hypothetical protein
VDDQTSYQKALDQAEKLLGQPLAVALGKGDRP